MADLTPTQRKVADLVGAGACYKDIGYALGIKDSTARTHTNAIASKLPDDGLTPYRRVMIWVICQNVEKRKAG